MEKKSGKFGERFFIGKFDYDSGDELLDKILQFSRGLYWGSDWIFRGVGDSKYRLIPSALRGGMQFPQGVGPATTNEEQIRLEYQALELFSVLADQQGLPIPGLSERFQTPTQYFRDVDGAALGKTEWPIQKMQQLMALAQHHGIPTRILDWSYSPFIGLYFAAADAVKHNDDQKRMSLWALNLNALKPYIYLTDEKVFLRSVNVPYSGNVNITAQKGTFTCIVEKNLRPDKQVNVQCVEQIMESLRKTLLATLEKDGKNPGLVNIVNKEIDHAPLLIKMTAPASHGRTLLRQLSVLGIKASSIYPGYEGVKRAAYERGDWDYGAIDALEKTKLTVPEVFSDD